MEISNFKDMYLAELQELVSVEEQLSEALLRMAAAASHPALKDALVDHQAETMRQKERLVGHPSQTWRRPGGACRSGHAGPDP